MQSREIRQIIAARPATDGAGVKIMRLTGFAENLKMNTEEELEEAMYDYQQGTLVRNPVALGE